jgi:hypothetical protein
MFRKAEGRYARASQADGRAINEKVRLRARRHRPDCGSRGQAGPLQADLLWHLFLLAPASCGTYTVDDYGRSKGGQDTMDANELRALQAPLKKQYREQPEIARTLARGEAMLDLDHIACVVHSWGGETNAGLHPATGGDRSLACSADMLLEALVA